MPLNTLVYFLAIFFPAFLMAAHPLGAQSTALAADHIAPMSNSDVVALVGVGLSEDIVIAKIQAAPATAFDTSVTGLNALKQANVPGSVIRNMINPHPPVAAVAGPYVDSTTMPAGDPDDPNTTHSAGLYTLTQGADGHSHMTKLESESPRGTKNSGLFTHVITHGITAARTQEVLDGAKAAIELPQARPVFYAYLPEYGNAFVGGLKVSDLVLTRLEVKGDTRLWTFAAHGLIGGSSEIGSDQKDRQGFTSEAIKPGIYKLTPAADLPSGQYAFKYSAFYFDFGILPQS